MSVSNKNADRRRTRLIVSPDSMPVLSGHVRWHHDKGRKRWVLLAPERLLEPDETALETLRMCDGCTTVRAISIRLGQSYNASADEILEDITTVLQDLTDKGFLRL